MFSKQIVSWNRRINVVSRKDVENLEVHHILFSLSIARFFSFHAGTKIMDAGTGGGLPGIPLAIFFPEVRFTLVDSIAKKIRVVSEISRELELTNITPVTGRFEDIPGTFDFITGRAVTGLPALAEMLMGKISPASNHSFPNGILYLKGGNFDEELKKVRAGYTLYSLSEYFQEPFFETKKLIHIYPFQ